MASPLRLALAERREIRMLLRKATEALRAAVRKHRRGLGAERRKLLRRQAALSRRIQRLATEYRQNRKKLREMAPAWEAITREIAQLEAEVAKLQQKEQRARQAVAGSRDARRTIAARRAGLRSAELTREWYDRYLGNVERGTGPNGSPISSVFAVAVARTQGWRYRLTPDVAYSQLNEIVHDNPHAEWEYANRMLPSLEKRWRREQIAAAVPF